MKNNILIFFILSFLLIGNNLSAQTDSDGDGIINTIDLDDDNDGILDADENSCIASSKIEGTPIFINDFGTGPRTTDPYVLNHTYTTGDANDGFYNVRTSGTTGANHTRTNVTGNKDAGNPTITNGTTTGRYLMINIDSPNNTNKAIYRVTGINTQVGLSYRFRIDMAGLAEGGADIPKLKIAIKDASNNELISANSTSLGMANDDVWRRLNLEFTATTSSVILEIINEQAKGNSGNDVGIDNIVFTPLYCDADNDGTPNQFDLDSDNDGCPDAIEGDENVTAAMLTNASGTVTVGTGSTAANQNLGTTVDAQGVPTVVNSGGAADVGSDQGQGIGDSQNIMVNSCAVPFICDTNMYLVQGDPAKLYRIDTSTNPFNFVQIGTGATYLVNATGYNPTDNFIYGISGGANVAKSLIRIDANGTFYNLGFISGLDIAAGYTSGEIDNNGNYYIKLAGTGNNKLYKVDIATRTATLIPLSRNINFIDIAYTQTDGLLWTQDTVSKKLVSINPTNGLVTDLPFVNTLNNYGAWFGSGTGQIYASSNDGTAFVEFDKTTGEAMFISTTQPSANNDGAHCPTAPITFDLYCRKLPVTNAGTQLPSNHGITALGRAGADNSNWPMVRQSAWTVLEAKTKGFVVNRVANPATDIANPVEGMMVFDTTAQCLKIYNGTVWSCYSTPACP